MKVIVGSDLHIPFQHKKAVSEFLEFVKKERPDVVVLNGDVLDMYSFSSHLKDPSIESYTMKEEVKEAKQFLKAVWDAVPEGCEIHYLEGNHENRRARLLLRGAPAFFPESQWRIPSLLGLDDLDINWHDSSDFFEVDGFTFLHGELLSIVPGSTARKHLQRLGCSVVVGHCHRLNLIHEKILGDVLTGVECGCLCSASAGAGYVNRPSWVLGWVMIQDGKPELILSRCQL